MNPVRQIRAYDLPPVNEKEVLRYLGASGANADTERLIRDCILECDGIFAGKVCFATVGVTVTDGLCDFGFCSVGSRSLAKTLTGCTRSVLFAATVGIGIDRMIRRYSALSPSRAVCLQAIGAERIEALCDLFSADIAEEVRKKGGTVRPRFSPGYGDLPLSFQSDLFRLLDCPRTVGITLNGTLLMSPTKSVTALIGITEDF